MGAILIVLAVLFLGLSAIAIVYVLGIRSKSSTVRKAARRFHRAVGNPLQMRSAGTPGARASVIRHRGRTTGKSYETPVWAVPTEDGFVIAIVYGSHTDWLKNVLASGAASIVHEGGTYPVDRPEIVPMERARPYFPAMTRRIHRPVRVDRCLRVRRVDVAKISAAQGSSYPEPTWRGSTAVDSGDGVLLPFEQDGSIKGVRRRR
jgi:deazaflavin-dependent oxidoreductase (nitroreductase family)